MPAPVFHYRRGYHFDLGPEDLWDRLQQLDQFESWWPWLTGFGVEGNGLTTGTVLSGVVDPPVPYRMRLRIELTECRRPQAIDARVGGDLVGDAHLRLLAERSGARVEATWTVEVMQPAMRLAARIARPALQWGHDRVVEMTLRNLPPEFRYTEGT